MMIPRNSLQGLRVCILRRSFLAHDKRSQQIALLLSKAGAEVLIVALSPGSSGDWTGRPYDVIEIRTLAASQARFRPVRIVSNLVRNRLRGGLTNRAMVREATRHHPDVVHCMSLFSLPLGFRIKPSASVVYDSREHFTTTGDVSGYERARRRRTEGKYASRAARVLTVSDPIAADLAAMYEIEPPVVIFNGPTTCVDAISPAHVPLRVLHLGRFYFNRNLLGLVDAVASLDGRVVLTLQGWGEDEDELRSTIEDRRLENVIKILPPCPPGQVVESVRDHDVGAISFRADNDCLRWSAPNKLFEYMGAGLAVVASGLPVIEHIVNEADCGRTYDPDDEVALGAILASLVDCPQDVERMKENALMAAHAYSWEAQADKLYAVYGQIASNRK